MKTVLAITHLTRNQDFSGVVCFLLEGRRARGRFKNHPPVRMDTTSQESWVRALEPSALLNTDLLFTGCRGGPGI